MQVARLTWVPEMRLRIDLGMASELSESVRSQTPVEPLFKYSRFYPVGPLARTCYRWFQVVACWVLGGLLATPLAACSVDWFLGNGLPAAGSLLGTFCCFCGQKLGLVFGCLYVSQECAGVAYGALQRYLPTSYIASWQSVLL